MGEQARTAMGPREVFARMRERWLDNTVNHPMDSLLADDAVIETPAEADQAQRLDHAHVDLAARHHLHGGRTDEPQPGRPAVIGHLSRDSVIFKDDMP